MVAPRAVAPFALFLQFLAVVLFATHPAQAEKRVALVIGINTYDNLAPHKQLVKAVNDSRSVAATLRELDFVVLHEEDVARARFNELWQRFLGMIGPGDTAAFYFSGHGIEIGGTNHLIARDTPPLAAGEIVLRRESANLTELMAELKRRGPRISLFIIDACRDNPFAAGGTKSIGRDLGLVPVQPPEGMFVLYSAGAGEKSLDRLYEGDHEPNSVFTRRLLPLMKLPRLTVQAVALQVRQSVYELAKRSRPFPHTQTPAYYDQILGQFCLVSCPEDSIPLSLSPPCQGVETNVAGTMRCFAIKDTFRDCLACPEMTVVSAGTFAMGSPPGETDRADNEGPSHAVHIARPFAVGRFEVTFDEWDACVSGGGCNGYAPGDAGWGRGRRPAMHVSWLDAKMYVEWLKAKTGQPYRLLTEAEWEYAARAGTTTPYHFGTDATLLCRFANGADQSATVPKVRNTSCNDSFGDMTAPVGAFSANPFGLHDMLGNVWEWVEDCHQDNYNGAPTDGSARVNANCPSRVVRGGSWLIIPRGLRSAYRAHLKSDYRDDDVGFRVARSITP